MRNLSRLFAPGLGAFLLWSGAEAAEPEVHMLVPGFEAKALPLRLTNINALAFSPDGKLFAAGYDGRVHRLIDTDGDGLEDKAEPFWDKGTLITPTAMVWTERGLLVASYRKISLLTDGDGDGKGDREEIVTTDWAPILNAGGNVDAVGLARGRDGSIYFGLGTADYANAYLVKNGVSRYDLKSERGTIVKLAPDRKKREIYATGIRFSYGLDFNRAGDLFATDQEGETWLPNGNPLDELNHIQKGRHYGFPPRHDKYLPKVSDEPPVIGFGPQHQSACGLAFNLGPRIFGPEGWRDDAFVAGESRGKLWRARLIKTPAGYVGRADLIAVVGMLALDVALSPKGSLYLSCHSGLPDWGTGPKGEGRLFKLTYADRSEPQPVIAWAASPLETRVAFDRPIDAKAALECVGKTIEFGAHARAADRFEAFKPPYKAVAIQGQETRGRLKIAAARWEENDRVLVLATDPHSRSAFHALTLPGIRALDSKKPGTTIDLAYDLSGVEAAWTSGEGEPENAEPTWTAWWPHFDPAIVRDLTAGSRAFSRRLAFLNEPGRLTLRAQLSPPKGEKTTLRVRSTRDLIKAEANFEEAAIKNPRDWTIDLRGDGEPVDLALTFKTGPGREQPEWFLSYRAGTDSPERPWPLERSLVPWAPPSPPASTEPATKPAAGLWAGGVAERGEKVFFGEEARCAVCHKFRGKGGEIGPDLSNLSQRDPASIVRDIAEPSATIHPDYVPYTVQLKDGRVAAGVVKAEGADAIKVFDNTAKGTVVPRSEIAELRPSSTSIMPVGLAAALGEAKMKDLLAFLTASDAEPSRSRLEPKK